MDRRRRSQEEALLNQLSRSSSPSDQWCRCSSTRTGCRMLIALLLGVLLLVQPALGRLHFHQTNSRLSTGVHERKDETPALTLPRKQPSEEEQQLNQIHRPGIDVDYQPLEQILSSLERRSLSGPGSSPPQCTSKCGRCYPCRPVHVPIQPGLVKTAEYYPEAWRCKCGNKLFMP